MLALSPLSRFECNCITELPLELDCELQNESYTSESVFVQFAPLMEANTNPTPLTMMIGDDDPLIAKKFNHNATERDRRKKINLLFSSLRSLLPLTHHRKRVSNPATVSEAIKYIKNLQKQVEAQAERRNELLSRISKRQENVAFSRENQRENNGVWSSSSAVSANRLNEREVSVQISTHKFQIKRMPLSHILLSLKEDGLHPLNVSSSESFGGPVFYTLHLQVEKYNMLLPCRILNEKVMRLYENIDYL